MKKIKDATETTPAKASHLKTDSMADVTVTNAGEAMTTNQGVKVSDSHNSLKAGVRGPTLLEDFQMREKITHFDHERIPERAVHARGTGAFGEFECYEDCSAFTQAKFLSVKGKKTPVAVRFSTVAGSRGSADTVRDVRGFSVKFYTEEGNYDLVGNNIPVFFIQDAMKFPDLVHAVKPEPHNEIPQASSAHDTFWDFISLMPESLHMIMWQMSDRSIPRSYRMMEGFGVHTFRFVNSAGVGTFVKFHWKPVAGIHGLAWDEASKLAGKDADFHRRDLWEAIESGNFPEWEFGVQLVTEADELEFDFDLLDPTKIIPEELVPVRRIGKLTLTRNVDNFFAEVEQIAFHPGHLVPGIDLTNDPLLQGRLHSYLDTQISRLGGANFHQIPVNRPLVKVRNNQRDGMHRQTVDTDHVAYEPSALGNGCPFMAKASAGAYVHYTERIEGSKVRARSPSFGDHTSQAKLFLNSLSAVEKKHVADAFSFELGKVATLEIRERMVTLIAHVDLDLATYVAKKVGVQVKSSQTLPPNAADPKNSIVPSNLSQTKGFAEAAQQGAKSKKKYTSPAQSAALSMIGTGDGTVRGRKFALLIAHGVESDHVTGVASLLEGQGAVVETISIAQGPVATANGGTVNALRRFDTNPSLVYDGVIIAGGLQSVNALKAEGSVLHFVAEAFKHCKAIACLGEGLQVLRASPIPPALTTFDGKVSGMSEGVIFGTNLTDVLAAFVKVAGAHRVWTRTGIESVPA